MATSHWTDISTRSLNSDWVEPTVLEQTSGTLRVRVHRHIHAPGVWFVSCHQLGIDRFELKPVDLAEAQKAAVDHVRSTAEALLYQAERLQGDTAQEVPRCGACGKAIPSWETNSYQCTAGGYSTCFPKTPQTNR